MCRPRRFVRDTKETFKRQTTGGLHFFHLRGQTTQLGAMVSSGKYLSQLQLPTKSWRGTGNDAADLGHLLIISISKGHIDPHLSTFPIFFRGIRCSEETRPSFRLRMLSSSCNGKASMVVVTSKQNNNGPGNWSEKQFLDCSCGCKNWSGPFQDRS